MRLIQKLKQLEKQIIFMRWATSAEYGKIIYVGEDYLEFKVLNIETMDYTETVFINAQLILEVAIGGLDISRIVAEISSNLPSYQQPS